MSATQPGFPSTPPGGDRLPGVVIEQRYRIDSRLARGGMSNVYRGMDLRLDRPVAVKVMSPQYAADPTFLARFEREARVAAKLDHPHLVGVYDQGRDGDHVFLVMELVDGGTLRDLLRQGPQLSLRSALSVLEPVLDGLAAAHHAGLIHRDVKPENILISHRGEVKVADFGVVRAVASTTMATGNMILGTVAYVSPEQVETGASDERSDVYSAGIVAYEMLTGTVPFAGETPVSVAYRHVHEDVPPVTRGAPGVPADIAASIDAATRRDPLQRPADAETFAHLIRRARTRTGLTLIRVSVPRREPPQRRGLPTTGTAREHPNATPSGAVSPSAAAHTTRAATRNAAARPPRPRRRWRRRVMALIVIAALAIGAAWGGWWLAHRWTEPSAAAAVSCAASPPSETPAQATAGCSAADHTRSRSAPRDRRR